MVEDKQGVRTEQREGRFPTESAWGSRKAHMTWARAHQEGAPMKRTAKSAQRDAGRSWGGEKLSGGVRQAEIGD